MIFSHLLAQLLLCTCIFSNEDSVRCIFSISHSLLPYNELSGNPCGVSDAYPCVSGWANRNAAIRSAQKDAPGGSDRTFTMVTVDDESALVSSHCLLFGLNHKLESDVTIDAYVLRSAIMLNTNDDRVNSWFAVKKRKIPPAITLLVQEEINPLLATILHPATLKRIGSHEVLFISLFDPGEAYFKDLEPMIRALHNTYLPDLTILLVRSIISATKLRFIDSPYVDVLLFLRPNATYEHSKRKFTHHVTVNAEIVSLFCLDWDFSQRNIHSVSLLTVNDASTVNVRYPHQFANDSKTLQREIDTVLGKVISADRQPRTICLQQECSAGNFLADAVYAGNPLFSPDIVLIPSRLAQEVNGVQDAAPSQVWTYMPDYIHVSKHYLYGSQIWLLLNSSIWSLPRMPLQMSGLRMEYDAVEHSSVNSTRLLNVEVYNRSESRWNSLKRNILYEVVLLENVTKYEVNLLSGSDLIYKFLHFSTRTSLQTFCIQWMYQINKRSLHQGYRIRGDYRHSGNRTPFLLPPLLRDECQFNTRWLESCGECEPCPVGTYQPIRGQEFCIPVSVKFPLSEAIITALILSTIIVLMLMLSFPIVWKVTDHYKKNRLLVKQRMVACELAEGIASQKPDKDIIYGCSLSHSLSKSMRRIYDTLKKVAETSGSVKGQGFVIKEIFARNSCLWYCQYFKRTVLRTTHCHIFNEASKIPIILNSVQSFYSPSSKCYTISPISSPPNASDFENVPRTISRSKTSEYQGSESQCVLLPSGDSGLDNYGSVIKLVSPKLLSGTSFFHVNNLPLTEKLFILHQIRFLRHNNLTPYLRYVVREDSITAVQDYTYGNSLSYVLDCFGNLPMLLVRKYARDICLDAAFLQRSGHSHGNICLKNIILIGSRCRVSGFCLPLDTSADKCSFSDVPEVYRYHAHNVHSRDPFTYVRAIGCMVTVMLTGKFFQEREWEKQLTRTVGDEQERYLAKSFCSLALTCHPMTRPSLSNLLSHPFLHVE